MHQPYIESATTHSDVAVCMVYVCGIIRNIICLLRLSYRRVESADQSASEVSIFYLAIYIYIYVCVGRKVWICAIHGLRCTNHGSVLRATIHGFRAQSMDRIFKSAKYKFTDNPWIALIAWFARRSSPRIDYRSQV